MPQLNYLIVERPFCITSTGDILKEKGYFVYSSSKSKFSDKSYLEGIYKDTKNIEDNFLGKITFSKSDYMIDEERVVSAFKFVENYLKVNFSKTLERALVEAMEEYSLIYEEIDSLELKCFRKF